MAIQSLGAKPIALEDGWVDYDPIALEDGKVALLTISMRSFLPRLVYSTFVVVAGFELEDVGLTYILPGVELYYSDDDSAIAVPVPKNIEKKSLTRFRVRRKSMYSRPSRLQSMTIELKIDPDFELEF